MAGALIVRSSWGAKWGEKGYDFLPYEYVINGLAEDWWTLIQQGWVDTGQFGE
jgi:C1A family cysteine protease